MSDKSYRDRMVEVNKHELSFEPKSIWEYKIGTTIDKLCDDKLYRKTLEQSTSNDWVKSGANGFMSKFVSENAKKVIEFWSKEGDTVLDPFAGRTRGLLNTLLKRNYIGFEVIKDNIDNIEQNYNILSNDYELGNLTLINSSSENIDTVCSECVDLVYTCPPYWNVEKYKSVDNQLSDIKRYDDFLVIYEDILTKASSKLKPGGFFVIVIANFRRNGEFIDFRTDTSNILKKSLNLHDEIILEMSPAKRHPLYTQAITNLNMLKTHEYCLVFRKPSNNSNEVNDEINNSRPLVSDFYDTSKLFWSKNKGKIDWINDVMLNKKNSKDDWE